MTMNKVVGKADYMWNEMRQSRWGLHLEQNKNNLNNNFQKTRITLSHRQENDSSDEMHSVTEGWKGSRQRQCCFKRFI